MFSKYALKYVAIMQQFSVTKTYLTVAPDVTQHISLSH